MAMLKRQVIDALDLNEESRKFFDEVQEEPDRACILMMGAFADHALGALLKAHFVDQPDVDKGMNKWQFEQRREVALFMGLISRRTHATLGQLQKIRNACAHWHRPVGFGDTEIRGVVGEMTHPLFQLGGYDRLVGRDRFVLAMLMTLSEILQHAVHETNYPSCKARTNPA